MLSFGRGSEIQFNSDNGEPAWVIRFESDRDIRLIRYDANGAQLGDMLTVDWTNGRIGFFGATPPAVDAITALTDNSAGTANDTVQAMPDPADAPGTPDALRDDLVANFIPAVRNNVADLAAKINELRTALVNLGFVS